MARVVRLSQGLENGQNFPPENLGGDFGHPKIPNYLPLALGLKMCGLYLLFPIFLELFLFPISESKFRGFLGNLAFHHRSSSLEKPVKIDQLLS